MIVSSNRYNESSIATVIVMALTSQLRLEAAPGNFRIPVRGSGLAQTSIALATQIATLDRRRLSHKVGRLPDELWPRLDDALRMVLGLA